MVYYRLKKELNWSLRDTGLIVYEGNPTLQLALNSENNTKLFNFLLFLSEFRDNQDIKNYSDLTSSEKEEIISYLIKKGVLQTWQNPIQLSRTELFLNCFPNADCLKFKNYQKSCKIIIVGLGTIGSHAFDLLVRIGFRDFTIIDGDKVEEKNIYAQSYQINDIGKFKVEVLKKRYKQIANIKTYSKFISTYSQLEKIIGKINSQDIIISAADDFMLMKSLANAVMEKELPCKVIESGYGPLIQTTYTIDSYETAQIFIDYIENNTKSDVKNINENSGSIMNGYLSAFMIGQLIISSFINKKNKVAEYLFFEDCLKWKDKI